MTGQADEVKTFVANLQSVVRNKGSVTVGGGIFAGEELEDVLAALDGSTLAPGRTGGHINTFSVNLKRAIFDRAPVDIGGGVFNTQELKCVHASLQQWLEKDAAPAVGGNVTEKLRAVESGASAGHKGPSPGL